MAPASAIGKDLIQTPSDNLPTVEVPKAEEPSLCADGVSTNDLICNPLGGTDGSAGGSSGGSTVGSNGGSSSGSSGGSTAGSTGGSTAGSSGGSTGGDVPSVPARRLGLIANIIEGQNGWDNVNRYLAEGYEHPEKVYFSNFNVPQRAFDDGFNFGASDYLKDRNGSKLIEWFAIKARGYITLPENESAGYFHIVTMSDDGIKVNVGGDQLINDPGVHSPLIKCSYKVVELKKGDLKSFNLEYFQGPRFHIALMTFIKRIDNPAQFSQPSSCNQATPDYSRLIDDGYKVITPAYFVLPDDI
jgi:hypothetical protein